MNKKLNIGTKQTPSELCAVLVNTSKDQEILHTDNRDYDHTAKS